MPATPPQDLPDGINDTYAAHASINETVPGLEAHIASVFLPTWDVAPQDSPTDALPQVPPKSESTGYRFLRRIGQGGMGEVWAALQSTLLRPVAVKRLLPGRGDRLTRDGANDTSLEFQLEAMVAGRLEHPNIVPIHDLGADDAGRPLIAMKLVEGKTWSDLLIEDFDRLAPADLLAKHLPILVSMANAVAYAHDRGVIHRDLKPSQVMVGAFGEVMLMDWGLAIAWKDTSRNDAPALALPMPRTASSPAGTPALMAPEQTQDTAIGVGPHTDVFLLGATLYFLLTGTFPYQASTPLAAFMKAAAIEQERPEDRAPSRWIPKELADIAMTALSPDAQRRQPSATAFRDAVADWMSGAARRREAQTLLERASAAIDANPSTYPAFEDILHDLDRARTLWPDQEFIVALYRQTKLSYARLALRANDLTLARTHAMGVGEEPARTILLNDIDASALATVRREAQRRWAIVGVIGLLLALLGVGAVFLYRLNESRLGEVAARREAEHNLIVAQQAGDGAYNLILFVLDELKGALERELTPDTGVTIPNAARIKHAIAGAVASPAVRYFQDLDTSSWPAPMRLSQAARMQSTGFRFSEMGRYDDGVALTTPSLAIRTALLGDIHPDTAASLSVLGAIFSAQGNHAAAESATRRALDIQLETLGPDSPVVGDTLNGLAITLLRQAKFEEAGELLERSLDILEQAYGHGHPSIAEALTDAAAKHQFVGRYAEARDLLIRAQAIVENHFGPDHPRTALVLHVLGSTLTDMGELAEADTLLERAFRIRMEELGPEHPDTASTMERLALNRQSRGDMKGAQDLLEDVVAIRLESLGPTHQNTGTSMNNLAMVLLARGDLDGAEDLFRRALAIQEKVFGPDDPGIAKLLSNLGLVAQSKGDADAAMTYFTRSLAVLEKVMPPDHPDLAVILGNVGMMRVTAGDLDAALPMLQRALAINETALGPDHHETALALTNLGGYYKTRGDNATAGPYFERALGIFDAKLGPDHPNTQTVVSHVANSYRDQGDLTNAKKFAGRLVADRERTVGPAHPGLASALSLLGGIELKLGNFAAAREAYERAVPILAQTAGPDHANTLGLERGVGIAIAGLSRDAHAAGRIDDAAALRSQAISYLEKNPDMMRAALPHARAAYAELLWRLGRLDDARAVFQSAADAGWPDASAAPWERTLRDELTTALD